MLTVTIFARIIPRTRRLAFLTPVLLLSGCYDAQVMIERVRNDAIQSRLEEVDLGEYHVTLPSDAANNEMTEVTVHLFGNSAHYRVKEIQEKLTDEEHELKQAVLIALRKTTNQDFAEPTLKTLQDRLSVAINSVLGDSPVEGIGFYDIRLVRH